MSNKKGLGSLFNIFKKSQTGCCDMNIKEVKKKNKCCDMEIVEIKQGENNISKEK